MIYSIFKEIPRLPNSDKISKSLEELGVATISEAQGKRGVMHTGIKPIQNSPAISGPAVTVECTEPDNLMIHASLEFCKSGDILVVKTPDTSRNGFFGELMATSASARGVRGLVIEGGVRDTSDLRKMGFHVWCSYITVLGTTKQHPGNVNVPILCGGVSVNPGDFVVADDDGVVIVRREEVDEVIDRGKARVTKESVTREKLKEGELGIDIYNLKPVLSSIGVKYEDGTYEGRRI